MCRFRELRCYKLRKTLTRPYIPYRAIITKKLKVASNQKLTFNNISNSMKSGTWENNSFRRISTVSAFCFVSFTDIEPASELLRELDWKAVWELDAIAWEHWEKVNFVVKSFHILIENDTGLSIDIFSGLKNVNRISRAFHNRQNIVLLSSSMLRT